MQRSIRVDRRYLILPVERGPMAGRLRLRHGRETVREFDIRLAEGPGDYQVFTDLEPYLGAELVIEAEGVSDTALDGIRLADVAVDPAGLYQERLRPQFHFSSQRGWNNDPNGLIYHDGEFHLFYQLNPFGTDWGNMHWGHAVSPDLVHWTELPVALYPDELGTIFSGSAVVDHANTSGLGSTGNPAIVAIYTAAPPDSVDSHSWYKYAEFTQCVATSTDRGRSWSKYAGNPVLPHIVAKNRDPKVIWHPETERWIMALYLEKSDYAIFASANLLDWERLSDVTLPGATECPEMFPLSVDGDEGDRRWVFWTANSSYLIGSFDGHSFVPEQALRKLQPEGRAYAAQTWSSLPAGDGRRVQIAWMRQALPGMPFSQFMTVPVSLGLTRRDDGIVLTAAPVRELERLREEVWRDTDIVLAPGERVEAGLGGELLDIEVDFDLGQADSVGLAVRGVSIWFDRVQDTLFCGAYSAPLPASTTSLQLRILADRASIELFADGGAFTMAAGVVLHPDDRAVQLFAGGGAAVVRSVRVSRLRSAWPG